MTPIAWWSALDKTRRRLVSVALLVLAIVVFLVTLSWCSENRSRHDANDEKTITDARMGSAEQAIDVIGYTATENAAVSQEVKEAQNELSQIDDPVERDRVARERLRDLQSGSAPAR